MNGSAKLAPLYNCFLTIIANMSPYAKSLSMVASTKIINLLEVSLCGFWLAICFDFSALP